MRNVSPPTRMLLCVLCMIALHLLLPLAVVSNWILFLFGIGLIAFGLVMAFGAEGQFRQRNTTVDHLGEASKLVTDGWFKYSRNPMYLSFLLTLLGSWLTLGSLSPLILIPIYVLFTEQWHILPEEKRLGRAFGKGYDSYRGRTRRWM